MKVGKDGGSPAGLAPGGEVSGWQNRTEAQAAVGWYQAEVVERGLAQADKLWAMIPRQGVLREAGGASLQAAPTGAGQVQEAT